MSALSELRILDFSRVLAGPFCTMLLGDLGADVIKIEQPESGDETRMWGPPYAGAAADGMSAYYLSVNRNKRSLTLNLKSERGRDLARELAKKSDVLIENFKVGGMRGFGLDYESLRQLNPALIYCSISGYGQTGSQAQQPGYDYVIQAQSGLMSITGPADGAPYKVGVAIADVITALTAANAIQAALLHRTKTGVGQYIDIALLDSQISALVNVASNYLVSRQPPPRYGNAHANIAPYETYKAADDYFILAVGNDGQFRRCCAVMGIPDTADDLRFSTNPARLKHAADLRAILQPILLTRSAQAWIAAFHAANVPAGSIASVADALESDQLRERGMIQHATLANGEEVDLVGSALHLQGTVPQIRLPPPLLGQHTVEVLREVLALSESEIAALREADAI
ncbi:MAG: CoA transferase [Anaerolineae bacterium]